MNEISNSKRLFTRDLDDSTDDENDTASENEKFAENTWERWDAFKKDGWPNLLIKGEKRKTGKPKKTTDPKKAKASTPPVTPPSSNTNSPVDELHHDGLNESKIFFSFLTHAIGIRLIYSKPVSQKYYLLKETHLKSNQNIEQTKIEEWLKQSLQDSISDLTLEGIDQGNLKNFTGELKENIRQLLYQQSKTPLDFIYKEAGSRLNAIMKKDEPILFSPSKLRKESSPTSKNVTSSYELYELSQDHQFPNNLSSLLIQKKLPSENQKEKIIQNDDIIVIKNRGYKIAFKNKKGEYAQVDIKNNGLTEKFIVDLNACTKNTKRDSWICENENTCSMAKKITGSLNSVSDFDQKIAELPYVATQKIHDIVYNNISALEKAYIEDIKQTQISANTIIDEIKKSIFQKDENFYKYLFCTKLKKNFRILSLERPYLEKLHTFECNSGVDFLANLRLSMRSQTRYARNFGEKYTLKLAEVDSGEIVFDLSSRIWRIGISKVFDNQKTQAKSYGIFKKILGRDHEIADIGSYGNLLEKIGDCATDKEKAKKLADMIRKHINTSLPYEINKVEVNIVKKEKINAVVFKEDDIARLTMFLFYAEAMRNPAIFVINQMLLDLIIGGHLDWKQATEEYMPMALERSNQLSRCMNNLYQNYMPNNYLYPGNDSPKQNFEEDMIKEEYKTIKLWLEKICNITATDNKTLEELLKTYLEKVLDKIEGWYGFKLNWEINFVPNSPSHSEDNNDDRDEIINSDDTMDPETHISSVKSASKAKEFSQKLSPANIIAKVKIGENPIYSTTTTTTTTTQALPQKKEDVSVSSFSLK